MVKIESHCCNCATPSYPCRGNACSYKKVEVTYCDHCDEEIAPGEVFRVDGEDLCEECLKEMFRKG